MCGICGRFAVRPRPPDLAFWNAQVDAMRRRGPDDRGLVHDRHAVLGNRRLAVLDRRRTGHLPMVGADGRFALAFNGELYNFAELRRELTARGHRFRSSGDSEVVLTALAEWGVDALDRFNGMFALAFHDRATQELLLARDHVGIKPLYVLEDPRGVVFGSEYEVCARHPWGRDREPDPEAVAMYLRWGHVPAPLGFHRGIGMLAPGSWLRVDATGRRWRGRYLGADDLDCYGHGAARGGPSPTDDEIDHVLRAAVARQAVADTAVGSLLSGGIDSPLLAALLTEVRGGPVDTFSVAMADPALDESADARRQAVAIGSRHRETVLDEVRAGELLDQAVAATHEPLADEGILPTLLVMDLVAEHVTVVLSGEGGDELFWGYTQRQPAAVRGRAGGYALTYLDGSATAFRRCFPGLPVWPQDGPDLDLLAGAEHERAQLVRAYELRHYLGFILLKADRASMHHSVEQRVPLLDREVIALAARLGWADCVDPAGGLGKLPLRRALARRTGFTPAPKRGFTAPVGAWLRTVLRQVCADSVARLSGLESVDPDPVGIKATFDRHLAGVEDHGMLLFRILMLDQWVQHRRGAWSGAAR